MENQVFSVIASQIEQQELQLKQQAAILENQKEMINQIREIARKQSITDDRILRLETKENRTTGHDGYVVQKGLGHKFRIAIGSQYVGILLRKSGLARQMMDGDEKRNSTVPYQRYLDSGLAKSYITETGYQHYVWDCEKTIERIEKYISSLGMWDEFIKINSTNKMKAFINRLPHYRNTYQYEVL